MGVMVCSKKGEKSIDLGGGGFLNLRQKVAELCSPEFGEHYKTVSNGLFLYGKDRENFYKDFDAKTLKLVEEKKVHIKVVDFCLQSDVEGQIRYGACKVIYEHIKDYDDDILYGYCGRPDCAKFADFKAIVKECIDLKCDLVWR